jgi:hypothetical protein
LCIRGWSPRSNRPKPGLAVHAKIL